MMNKLISEIDKDLIKYEEEFKLLSDDKEKEKKKLKQEYLNNLRLYLYDANNFIKRVFSINLTPYIASDGYNALLKEKIDNFAKKSKEEFVTEVNNLINSQIYKSLNEENKKLARTAFYVIVTYYIKDLE